MLNPRQTPYHFPRIRLWVISCLVMGTLACSLLGGGVESIPRRIVMLTRLPTFTPTPLAPLATPEPAASAAQAAIVVKAAASPAANLPTESTVVAPSPTSPPPQPVTDAHSAADKAAVDAQATIPPETASTAAATPLATSVTAIPDIESGGWSFTGVQVYPDQFEDGLLLYGEVINNTGTAQELDYISGTFYNTEGKVIAGEDNTVDQWPLDIIPPGAHVPFGLTVDGIQNAANFDLTAYAEPSDEIPRQDFELSNANSFSRDGKYCVTGTLKNLGNPLEAYLMVVIILYNDQNNVGGFDVSYEFSPQAVLGDQTLPFEVCADPHNQNVASYDLRAWGT